MEAGADRDLPDADAAVGGSVSCQVSMGLKILDMVTAPRGLKY